MTTNDSQVIRLRRSTVERIDELRGTRSRDDFLLAAMAQPVTRSTTRSGGVKSEPCRHPIGRRIGKACGVCGALVG